MPFGICLARTFATTGPRQNYVVNKDLVLSSLEQNARISASKALLEQFNKVGPISEEDAKKLLKTAHARISEIIIFFIVWCKDDEKYMTVGYINTHYMISQLNAVNLIAILGAFRSNV